MRIKLLIPFKVFANIGKKRLETLSGRSCVFSLGRMSNRVNDTT